MKPVFGNDHSPERARRGAARSRSLIRAGARIALATAGLVGLVAACSSQGDSAPTATTNSALNPIGVAANPVTYCSAPTPAAGDTSALSLTTVAGLWRLTASAEVAASGATTTTWTLTEGTPTVLGSRPVVAGTSVVAQGTTTTTINYGSGFLGLTQTSFTSDGTTLSGSINGRAIVPESIASPSGAMKFADNGAAPTVTVLAGIQSSIYTVLDGARGEIPFDCPGGGKITDGGASAAASALLAALWHAPTNTNGKVSLPDARPTLKTATLPHAVTPATTRPQGVHVDTAVTGASEGTPGIEYASQQNNALDFETPDCQSCVRQCATQPTNWFVPWGIEVCMGSCFIPGNGCGETVCPITGIASCDKGQTCCGNGGGGANGGCCAAGEVCGDYNTGTCCPASSPVACGGACFPAGSTCCGSGINMACGSGEACVNTGTAASQSWGCCPKGQVNVGPAFGAQQCCAADEVASDGSCCATPLCNGQCCNGGSCQNGACCIGPTNAQGACCLIGESVIGGACCAQSQSCGSSCCATGQSCLNAATGQCGVPANTCTGGKVICNYGDQSYCCGADQNCNGSMPGCCGGSEPNALGCIIK